jgi:hypothetical protein
VGALQLAGDDAQLLERPVMVVERAGRAQGAAHERLIALGALVNRLVFDLVLTSPPRQLDI